jgi:hypothetical protein
LELQPSSESGGGCEDDLPADRDPACEPGCDDLLAGWSEGCYPVVLSWIVLGAGFGEVRGRERGRTAGCGVDGRDFGEGASYCYRADE